jgi:hypothetical protein
MTTMQLPPSRPQPATPSISVPTAICKTWAADKARLHSSAAHLFDHIERHFHEANARRALRAAYPFLNEYETFQGDLQAFRWNRNPDRSVTDPTIEAYGRVIRQSIHEAAEIGFLQTVGSTTITLDSAGLLVVIDSGRVVTAFIPSIDHELSGALNHDGRSRHEIARDLERRKMRDPDERYYYDIFRPAIQQIRRYPIEDPIGGIGYGSLKRVLPRFDKLDLFGWLGLRRSQSHGAMEFPE